MNLPIVRKVTAELMPGDCIVNVGKIERVSHRSSRAGANYYWLEFSQQDLNRGAAPNRDWYCWEKLIYSARDRPEAVRGVSIE